MGTSKNSRYRSRATRFSSNDSGLFSFRFVDVHSRTVRDWRRNQFFEVPIWESRQRVFSDFFEQRSRWNYAIKSGIVGLVSFCTARPPWILVVALILGAGSATYAVQHFALKTDVNDLISQNLPWG